MLDIRIRITFDTKGSRLPQTPLRVARHRVLDLDDVGAPLREHRTRRGNETVHRDLDDADAVEWLHDVTTFENALSCWNSSSPALPISRPMPDCL